jgi:hypothetical protein
MPKLKPARFSCSLLKVAILCFITATCGCRDRTTPAPATVAAGHRGECEAFTQKLNGTKWQYAEGTRGITGVTMTLNADGSIKHSDPNSKWHWTAIDAHRMALIYDDGSIDTLTFNDAFTEYKQWGEGWKGKRLTADSEPK